MNSIFTLAWRNLTASRVRTSLCIIAVAMGVAITIATNSLGQSLRKALLASDEMRLLLSGLLDQFDPYISMIGVVTLIVAGFLMFNAFNMSVAQRRSQLGALRTLGMTRDQVWRMLLTEAVLIGVFGALLGLVVGLLMITPLIALISNVMQGMLAFETAPPTTFILWFAPVVALVIALIATALPAYRATHAAPLDAVREPFAAPMPEKQALWGGRIGALILVGLLLFVTLTLPATWVTYPMDVTLVLVFMLLWIVGIALVIPALVSLMSSHLRDLLQRTFAASGRLIADNLARARGRAASTALTLTLGLTVIIGMTGFMQFLMKNLMLSAFDNIAEQRIYYAGRFDPAAGWQTIMDQGLDSMGMSEADIAAVTQAIEGQGTMIVLYYLTAPELSFFGDAYYSQMLDAEAMYRMGDALITFSEGDWETALPIMREGCGVLIMPLVAARNGVGVGDSLTVTNSRGQSIECTVAGIGSVVGGSSIISLAARDSFPDRVIFLTLILPNIGIDHEAFEAQFREQVPNLSLNSVSRLTGRLDESTGLLLTALNMMLLLAVLTAALGMVNTVMMNALERRRELGLLRAVGATPAQTRLMLMGEAALLGLLGGFVGLFAGLGFVLILVLTYGGGSWGVELDLWAVVWDTIGITLPVALTGLIASPLICALAAWLPTRQALKESPVEALAMT